MLKQPWDVKNTPGKGKKTHDLSQKQEDHLLWDQKKELKDVVKRGFGGMGPIKVKINHLEDRKKLGVYWYQSHQKWQVHERREGCVEGGAVGKERLSRGGRKRQSSRCLLGGKALVWEGTPLARGTRNWGGRGGGRPDLHFG